MNYKIRLDMFEGPLDLLLYLIKRDELDIYDIPITRITEQYLEYINSMQELDLDIAGEFLVMAATLMHIKSKTLLPPDPTDESVEEEDPRAELVRRLIEYKTFKEASERLRIFEQKRSSIFTRLGVEPELQDSESPFLDVTLFQLIDAFNKALAKFPDAKFHEVNKDEFTVADKVEQIRYYLGSRSKIYFSHLFAEAKNKFEVITIFLAILELMRLKEVSAKQNSYFDDIEILRKTPEENPWNEAN